MQNVAEAISVKRHYTTSIPRDIDSRLRVRVEDYLYFNVAMLLQKISEVLGAVFRR